MSKTLTKYEVNEKKFRRINDKSLRQLLIHRFINAYGYDKGEVTAQAIVDDILNTIEHYFVVAKPLEQMATGKTPLDERFLRYGQLVWMAVPVDEFPQKGKSIVKTRMKPIILTYLAAEDIETIRNGFTSRQLRINRMVRWCEEAYDQGALLTQLDLAILLNCCDAVVSDYANEYQRASGRILPTRGNIHDLSGAITHKREIIALYLQGCLTPTIANKTKHSKEAVDRYIRDYENVKLIRSVTDDVEKISQITHLSKRVIEQYLVLIPEDELDNQQKPGDRPLDDQQSFLP
jgi:predicted transcriptional regulator